MLGAVVLEDAAQVRQAADRDDVGDEDRRSQNPLDQPEEEGVAELVLDQAGQPDRDDEEEPDRQRHREDDRQPPDPAADLLLVALLVLLQLCVGGDRQGAEADLQRLAERDDAADHRHPPEPVPLRPRNQWFGAELDLALGVAHRDRPGRDAAHHHPLQHRLPANRRVALGDQGAIGHAQRIGSVRGSGLGVLGAHLRAHGLLPGLGVLGGASLEPLDPTTGVDQLLLAGVERVALGAELDVQIRHRGARVELVAARAMHVGERVLGVNSCLHGPQV